MMTSKVTKLCSFFAQGLVRPFCSEAAPMRLEKSLNSVTLLGRVGGDPQSRGSAEHPAVIFSVATNENYKYDGGDWMQRTEWHRVVVFRPNLRESVLQYLRKGQRALIKGKISYGEITDMEGQKKTATSIIADDVIFINNQPQTPSQ